MNRRAKQFWLPTFLNLGGTMVLMMLLQKWTLALQPSWKHDGVPVLPYLVWFLVLPMMGAATASICARTGAGTIPRVTAVLSPALVILAMWFLILLFGARRPIHWGSFFFGLSFWAGVPTLGLAFGDWIFRSSQNTQKQRASTSRQRRFWIPALISLSLSMVTLAFSTTLGRNSYTLAHGWSNQVAYVPWIVLSPLCGAAGAYWSGRAGGSVLSRLGAGLFPAVAMLGLGIVLVTTGAVTFAVPQIASLCRGLISGVLIPSLALVLGTLPFLRKPAPGTPKIAAAALK